MNAPHENTGRIRHCRESLEALTMLSIESANHVGIRVADKARSVSDMKKMYECR